MNGLDAIATYLWIAVNFMKSYTFHIQSFEDTAVTGKLIALPSCITSSLFCSLFLRGCAQNCLNISWAQAQEARKEGRISLGFWKENFVFSGNGLLLALTKHARFPCAADFYKQFLVITTEKLSRIRPFEVLLYSGLHYVNLWK